MTDTAEREARALETLAKQCGYDAAWMAEVETVSRRVAIRAMLAFADAERTEVASQSAVVPETSHSQAAGPEDFYATVYVSADGEDLRIEHKFDADWHIVKRVHEALRDWSIKRLIDENECPFKPASIASQSGGEALRPALQALIDASDADMSEAERKHGFVGAWAMGTVLPLKNWLWDNRREILAALSAARPSGESIIDPKPEIEGDPLCKIMSYNDAHENAVEMGYPSIIEALEHLDQLRAQPSGTAADTKAAEGVERLVERSQFLAETPFGERPPAVKNGALPIAKGADAFPVGDAHPREKSKRPDMERDAETMDIDHCAHEWINTIPGVRATDQFIAADRRALEKMVTRLIAAIAPADPALTHPDTYALSNDGVSVPDAYLVAEGQSITLAECPIGLFMCRGELCLKTEYGNNEGRVDAYIVSSGEFFWGGAPQTIVSQRAQRVVPVSVRGAAAYTPITASPALFDKGQAE